MNFNIREAVINNFQDESITNLIKTINDSVGKNDETLQLKALKCEKLQKCVHLMKCKKWRQRIYRSSKYEVVVAENFTKLMKGLNPKMWDTT